MSGGVFLRSRWRATLASITLLLLWPAVPLLQAQDAVVVIVHADNLVSTFTTREVSDLFLKKAGTFSDGTKAVPVDLGERSDVRGAFSRWVHRKTTSAVKAYWQQMIFSGRGVPPPEKNSTADVMTFVRSQRGGIGYVPQGTPLSPGVKAVTVQ